LLKEETLLGKIVIGSALFFLTGNLFFIVKLVDKLERTELGQSALTQRFVLVEYQLETLKEQVKEYKNGRRN
jgi:hypothetical protein